jgi:hypothetical protein
MKLPFVSLASLHKLSETLWTSQVDVYMKTTRVTEREIDKGRLLQLETWNALEIMLTREERANNIVEAFY